MTTTTGFSSGPIAVRGEQVIAMLRQRPIVSTIGLPIGQKSLMIECTPFTDNGWAQESMDPDPPSNKLAGKCRDWPYGFCLFGFIV